MNTRIRFTRMELEVINDMAAIASAAAWGEGDYLQFSENRSRQFDSMRRKVWELLDRMPLCVACDQYPCVCRRAWLLERKLAEKVKGR